LKGWPADKAPSASFSGFPLREANSSQDQNLNFVWPWRNLIFKGFLTIVAKSVLGTPECFPWFGCFPAPQLVPSWAGLDGGLQNTLTSNAVTQDFP